MNPDLVSTTWPHSLWKATATPLAHMNALTSEVETEVGIIGAGYTGLSTALHLGEAGVASIVVDRNQPGWGCSGRNGGQVNPNWKVLPDKLKQYYDEAGFRNVISLANETCDLVFDLIKRYQIDCHAIRPGYVLGVIGQRGVDYVREWHQQWQVAGAQVAALNGAEINELLGTERYDGGMLDRRGGSLQPLSYSRGLATAAIARGSVIYGDSPVQSVTRDGAGWCIATPTGRIRCHKVVIGTNGYTDNAWPRLKENIVPVASLISATEPLPDEIAGQIIPGRNAVSEAGGVPHYYRIDENNRMVFGGRGTVFGRTGNLDTHQLRRNAIKLFPLLKDAKWEFDWGGYVAMTTHHRPMLLGLDQGVFAGLGYNGRGVSMATMMGKQLALAAMGQTPQLAMESSSPIPLHRFYSLGIAARIIGGSVMDRFTRRIGRP